VDYQKDRFDIRYDPKKLTPEQMLKTVSQQGLEGELVPDGS
jgi:hypothetical protein